MIPAEYHIFNAVLLVMLVATQLWHFCNAGLILAKSDLDVCVNTGDPKALQCSKKILMTITVPSGQTGEESALVAEVKDPSSKSGKQVLAQPINVKIAKTQSTVEYPLSYIQNVNADPWEKFVFRKKNCQMRLDEKATCGVIKDAAGRLIPGSQGFCCQCEGMKKWKYFRGKPTPSGCSKGDPGYAFCLRFGSMWYSVFRIGLGVMRFEISITISDATGFEIVKLGPDVLSGINTGRTVLANLAGDLASYTQIPNLEGKYFNFPLSDKPQDNWLQFTPADPRSSRNVWIILDSSRYDFSGAACDKIGISYEGFQRQPNGASQGCQGTYGMCLRNQIIDFLKEDQIATRKGNRPIYSINKYGDAGFQRTFKSTEAMSIIVPSTVSIVTLEIAADSISFVRNKSPGKILSATIAPFEAMSTAGRLIVKVLNNGKVPASYGLYPKCTKDLVIIPGISITLLPNIPAEYTFDVSAQSTKASSYSCGAMLKDSEGEEVDRKEVKFKTTVTQFSNGTQGTGVEVGGRNDTFGKPKKHKKFRFGGIFKGVFSTITAPFRAVFGVFDNLLGKCDKCPETFDVTCFIRHMCLKKIAWFVGTILAILLGVYFMFLLQSIGMLSPVLGCFCLPLKILLSVRPPSLPTSAAKSGDVDVVDGDDAEAAKGRDEDVDVDLEKRNEEEEVDYEGVSNLFDKEEEHAENEDLGSSENDDKSTTEDSSTD